MSNSFERLSCLLAVAYLASCGGGGNDDDPPANAAPTILPQNFAATEDAAFTGAVVAQDPGDTLAYSAAANPTHGTLALTAAGGFTYQPATNYFGTDTFTVRVVDSASNAAQAVMTVNVANVNDAPTAANDVLTLTSAADIEVLANDTDIDDDALTVSIVESFPAGATVGANRRITVPVSAGFKGVVRVGYRVTDAGGLHADATALAYVNIPPFKLVFLGGPAGAADIANRILVNDLMRTVDVGNAQRQVVELDVSRNGRGMIYKERIPLGGSNLRHELFYVDLTLPNTRYPITGEVAEGLETGPHLITDDGRRVVYVFSVTGVDTSLYVFDAQAAATLGHRISPPSTEIGFVAAPVFDSSQNFVYYGAQTSAGAGNPSAAFRTEISTATTTRVSPLVVGPQSGPGVDWVAPTPDESVIITHRLETVFPPEPHNYVEINDRASPDTSQLLHPAGPAAMSFEIPLVSPDGLFALLYGSSRLTLARTDTPLSETHIGPANFSFESEFLPQFPDRRRVMRADSAAALLLSGCGSLAPAGKPCDVYELRFADPANPVRINQPNADSLSSFDPAYVADGAGIVFRDATAGGGLALKVVRRGAFGTEVPLSAAGQDVDRYKVDSSGQVVLYAVNVPGQPGQRLMIANVDAPGEFLEVGVSRSGDPFAITAR